MSSLSYNKSRIIIFRAFLGIDVNEKSDDDPTNSKENPNTHVNRKNFPNFH